MPNYTHGHVPVQILVSGMLTTLKASSLTGVSSLPARVEGRVALSQTLSRIKTCLESNGATGLTGPGIGPVELSQSAEKYKLAMEALL